MKRLIAISLILSALTLGTPLVSHAQSVDVNNPDINSPGFKLVICDGPDMSGTAAGNPVGYTPCNFKTFMMEAQYLINVMIILGVAAAIVGFAWAGWLYVTGTEKNINRAKGIFPKLGIGFILMLTAWFIVSQILIWLTGSSSYLTGAGL